VATYRGAAGSATNTSLSSLPVALPAGWQPGDFCIIAGGINSATATFTDPAGWTLSEKGALSSGGLSYFYYWRILQAGDTDPVVVSSVSGAYRYMSAAYTPAAGRKFQFDANGTASGVTTAGTSITPPACSSRAAGSVSILVTMGRGSGTVTQTAFANTPPTNYTNGNPFWGPSGSSYTGHPFIVNQHNLNGQNITTLTPSAETVASTPSNTYFMSSMHYNVTEVAAENWTAEGGTDATPITTGNSGGASGDALDYASIGSGATLNYETAQKAHGSLSAAVAVGVTSTTCYFGYLTAHAKLYARFYLRVPSVPTANTRLFGFYSAGPITTVAAFLRYATTGKLVVCDSASATQWTSTNNLPLNQWIRVEFWAYASATIGQFKISYYNTPDSDTPTETFTSAATLNLSTTIAAVIAGISIAQASVPKFWIDDLAYSNLEQPNVALSSGTVAVSLKKMSVSGAGAGSSAFSGAVALKKMRVAGTGAGSSAFSGAVSMKKMGVAGSGAGSSSGSGAVKLKKMSIAGTGSVSSVNTVTVSISLKKMGVSGTGAGTSSATGATSLKKMKVAGSAATVPVSASGAVSLKKMSVAGSAATVPVSASGAVKLKKMSVAGTGSVMVTVSGSVSLKKMGVSASATGTSTASGGVTLKKGSISGSASGISSAAGAVKLKKMGISGSASVAVSATAAVVMKKMVVSGAVTCTTVASGVVGLKKCKLSGSGTGIAVLSGGPSLKKMGVSGAATVITVGTGNVSLKKMGVSGTGPVTSVVSGAIVLKRMSVAGAGQGSSATAGAVSMKKMKILGSGEKLIFVDGYVRMKKMGVAGSGTGSSALSGNVILKKMSVAGFVTCRSATTGAISLKKMSIFGSGEKINFVVVSVRMKKMGIAGNGAGVSALTGVIRLKKMIVLGTGQGLVVVTGDVHLKKMRVSGSVLATSVATGSVSLVKMGVHGEGSVTEAEISDLSGNVAMKKMRVTGRGGMLVTGRSSQLFIFSPL
jgi:hypothetical protein